MRRENRDGTNASEGGAQDSGEPTVARSACNTRAVPAAAETTGALPPPDSIVHVRLVTPLDSATSTRGTSVEAVVTQPVFSASTA